MDKFVEGFEKTNKSAVLNYANKTFGFPIIVTGASRGGTSLVASLCRAAGINMGSKLGENHEDPIFHNSFYPEFDGKKFVRAVNIEREGAWGFKLPKAAMWLDNVEELIGNRNPTYVFVFRSPMAAATSEYLRGGTFTNSIHFSSIFYSNITSFARRNSHKRNIIYCDYSELSKDPKPFILMLARVIGVEFGDKKLAKMEEVNTGESGGYLSF